MTLKWNNGPLDKTCGFNLEKLSQKESRFHSIYLIDSLSGAVLVSNKYSDNLSETNEDLISGFLNAINMFIREIRKEKEEIQEINFNDSRILYERKERLVVIGISKKTNLQIERHFLHEILNDFYYRFKNQINIFKGLIPPKMLDYKKNLRDLSYNSLFNYKLKL